MVCPQFESVADVIAYTLHRYGARFAFGIPGNDVLETVRACEEQGIEFVLASPSPPARSWPMRCTSSPERRRC